MLTSATNFILCTLLCNFIFNLNSPFLGTLRKLEEPSKYSDSLREAYSGSQLTSFKKRLPLVMVFQRKNLARFLPQRNIRVSAISAVKAKNVITHKHHVCAHTSRIRNGH